MQSEHVAIRLSLESIVWIVLGELPCSLALCFRFLLQVCHALAVVLLLLLQLLLLSFVCRSCVVWGSAQFQKPLVEIGGQISRFWPVEATVRNQNVNSLIGPQYRKSGCTFLVLSEVRIYSHKVTIAEKEQAIGKAHRFGEWNCTLVITISCYTLDNTINDDSTSDKHMCGYGYDEQDETRDGQGSQSCIPLPPPNYECNEPQWVEDAERNLSQQCIQGIRASEMKRVRIVVVAVVCDPNCFDM